MTAAQQLIQPDASKAWLSSCFLALLLERHSLGAG
jgi:hypothetical protein